MSSMRSITGRKPEYLGPGRPAQDGYISTNMAGRGTDIKLGDGVPDLGGLHVLGTERHESRRVDRQLRGRCARQGDPGSSRFYVSFEDDLMRNFGASEKMTSMMERFGLKDGEELSIPGSTRALKRLRNGSNSGISDPQADVGLRRCDEQAARGGLYVAKRDTGNELSRVS